MTDINNHTLAFPEAPSGGRFLLGLLLLTIPAIIYSLAQMGSLVSGGSLDHAVRALMP